ncbi:Zn-ribbon domain-containing OB-fold protein [Streptomyces mangrovisoli]|uniref:ChsH2 rubredoxin-like zinc ribbon domain-containing protein n=1 Tax=Streptomyces mangrovisoli TaxID=1428628 RepID=A0A1J4P0W7_9ACTN|nr:zinc ribbon domain-containing protein [Streptomyces mangrovisoli]OIJ68259.1 hypothetical protein WN71_008725 [Streptomyces mangrovisoli]
MYVRTVQREQRIGPPTVDTELRYQRCTWCSTVVFRTVLLCPTCSSTELCWSTSPGHGTVSGVVEVRRKGHRPRMVAVVELADGVRMRCLVKGMSPCAVTPFGASVSIVEVAPDGIPVFRLDPLRRERW